MLGRFEDFKEFSHKIKIKDGREIKQKKKVYIQREEIEKVCICILLNVNLPYYVSLLPFMKDMQK